MDILKLTTEEIRGFAATQMNDVEVDIRKQLAEIKMDVYASPAVHTGNVRKLKKSLARVLTVKSEKNLAAK